MTTEFRVVGDVSNDSVINNRDLAILMQYINGCDIYIDDIFAFKTAADVNGDGAVNNRDYALLMQYVNGWDVELKG